MMMMMNYSTAQVALRSSWSLMFAVEGDFGGERRAFFVVFFNSFFAGGK
jgi:hypothetical protein